MIDDRGQSLTDATVLHQVSEIGAIVIVREPVEAVDFATWRRELRRAARRRGMRLSVRTIEDQVYLVHNPDHVLTDQQRREGMAAIMAGMPDIPSAAAGRPSGRTSRRQRHLTAVPPPSP